MTTSQKVGILLNQTNFYAEQGGQIYDTGFMSKCDDEVFIHHNSTQLIVEMHSSVVHFWYSHLITTEITCDVLLEYYYISSTTGDRGCDKRCPG